MKCPLLCLLPLWKPWEAAGIPEGHGKTQDISICCLGLKGDSTYGKLREGCLSLHQGLWGSNKLAHTSMLCQQQVSGEKGGTAGLTPVVSVIYFHLAAIYCSVWDQSLPWLAELALNSKQLHWSHGSTTLWVLHFSPHSGHRNKQEVISHHPASPRLRTGKQA